MKFKARYLMEHEVVIEAADVGSATELLVKNLEGPVKLLGVIPLRQEWPDTEKPTPRPPRNTPPGGSPGTPSLPETAALLNAVAA